MPAGPVHPLVLDEIAALQLARLPNLHRDPFDRMLVCQAIVNGLTLLTPGELIAQYPIRSVWWASRQAIQLFFESPRYQEDLDTEWAASSL